MLHHDDAARADAVLAAVNRSLAVIEFDPAGTILRANRNFLDLMGYEAEELIGRPHAMFVAPDHARSADYAAFWTRLGRGDFDSAEYKRYGKGGREVWIQATYNPVFDPQGKVERIVKFAADVTAAKMKASEDAGKMQAISRAQAIVEFGLDGGVLGANENFLAIFGYERSEIVGRHHAMFVEPDYARSADYAEFWARLRAGEFFAEEFRRLGKDGREVWIQASYNPIFDPDGRIIKIVKFAADVSGRVRAVREVGKGLGRVAEGDLSCEIEQPFIPALDRLRLDFNSSVAILKDARAEVSQALAKMSSGLEQLRRSERRLQAANAAKSQFLSRMSHEFRTPLNGVIGLAAVLRKTATDEQAPMLDTIIECGRSLGAMTDRILDLNRFEDGDLALDESDFEIAAVLAEAAAFCRPQAEEKGLDFAVETSAPCGPVRGDAARVTQIVSALAANAVKFTQTGGVRVAAYVLEESSPDAVRLCVVVEDTGVGVPEDAADAIFEPFAQADDSITRRQDGAGLGLPLARRLCEAMGGALTLERPAHGGSRFRAEMRLLTAAAARAA